MKSILIIGATGFIGRYLAKAINDYDVTYLVRKGKKMESNGKIFYGDIVNKEDVITASKGKEIIVNLAAPNTQNYNVNMRVIVDGTKNIIEAAKKNKIRKIITLSSYAAYRKNLDNYGKAKKEADKLLMKSGLKVIILKPTMVYGKGGYAFNKLVSSVKKVPFFVFVIGGGRYKIQPTYIGDVVEVIKKSLKSENRGIKVLDIGGPYPIEYNEFVKKVLKIIHKKKVLVHLPLRLVLMAVWLINLFNEDTAWNTTSIKRMVEPTNLDIEKTKRELGIRMTEYEKGLKDVIS